MAKRSVVIFCWLISGLILTGGVEAEETDSRLRAQETGYPFSTKQFAEPTFDCGKGCAGFIFPASNLYPPHLADPHRAGFGVQRLWYTKSAIPDASDDRLNVKVGGVFGIVRVADAEHRDTSLQIGIIGAYDGLYDFKNSLDNIGWNGDYGLELSGSLSRNLAAMINWHHRSSHLGDEYIEKTGRKRIGYTREELSGGLSYVPWDGWHLYAETGWGIGLGNNTLMKPWRVQGGMEYRRPQVFFDKVGWYGAFDTTSMEERGWRADFGLQAGLFMESAGRTWRLGIEHYRGRPTIGDFFMLTERYLSCGIWMDW